MIFASSPERGSWFPVENSRIQGTQGCPLPPLSSVIRTEFATPSRPRLPSVSSFSTPETPRFLLPSLRPTGNSYLATLPENTVRPPMGVAITQIMGATPAVNNVGFSVSTHNIAPNTSMDSDADTSINDSMVKQSSKRKYTSSSPTRDFAFISHSPATYPSQEPNIDNASLARRKRRRTSPKELALLNEQFKLGSTPDKARRIDIANKVNMSEKAVQIWFQNKRQSLRKLKNIDKEVTELPPTPNTAMVVPPTPNTSIMVVPPTPNTAMVVPPTPNTSLMVVSPTSDTVMVPSSNAYIPSSGTPLCESTPIRPTMIKSESQHFVRSSPVAQYSPTGPFYTSSSLFKSPHLDVPAIDSTKGSLLSKMLASKQTERTEHADQTEQIKQTDQSNTCHTEHTELKKLKREKKSRSSSSQLVMHLTNKKQPEFARQSALAATQVRTFKLTPMDRKPLGVSNTNTLSHPRAPSTKDSQCIQGLLSLKVGHP